MISIREVQISDAPRLAEIYSYYVENTAVSFEYEAPIADEFVMRIKCTTEKYPYAKYAGEAENAYINRENEATANWLQQERIQTVIERDEISKRKRQIMRPSLKKSLKAFEAFCNSFSIL